jgi:RimJ/RimL family protein N-acetyltransferase
MQLHIPEIHTPRLIVLELTPELTARLFDELSAEEAIAALRFPSSKMYHRYKGRFWEMCVHNKRISFCHYLIYSQDQRILLGDCSFHLISRRHERAEIGYGLLREEDQNKGYMAEALEPILQRGFKHHDFQRIEAFTTEKNIPSMRLLRRFGFHREGIVKRHYVVREGEKAEDSIAWGLLPENLARRVDADRITAIVQAFENHSLPLPEWTHQAHLTTALYYLHHFGLDIALCKMRAGIILYNQALLLDNTTSRGYHETLTLFWMRLIDAFLKKHPEKRLSEQLDLLLGSEWGSRDVVLRYYSEPYIMSTRARAQWVEPDIKAIDF